MGYRILVVDDSPVLRLMLQEMLESFGHEVVAQADTGAAGIQSYRETKPDLVTLDISLPDQDGLSVLKELRKLDPQVRAIIITGNDQRKLQEQAAALKALGILRKPFDVEQLGALLEKIAPSMNK
ncbi:MAG: response regulator [Elusimicrobiota bacterium]|jgi:two-component system chemotaxis response regulator CheY